MDNIVDLSQFNTVSDWDTAAASISAAIVRLGYTYSRDGVPHIDSKYLSYRNELLKRHIPMSLYWFTNAITEEEARNEADIVAAACTGIPAPLPLPVFCDSESVDGLGRADHLDRQTRTRCVRAFCSRLQALGVPAGVYSNPDWMTNHLDMDQLPFSLWVAHWGVDVPATDRDYLLHQYTNAGSLPGFATRVDVSRTKQTTADHQKSIAGRLKAEIGYVEKRDGNIAYLYEKTANAGSENYTKYGYEMHRLQPANMDYPAAWCACLQSWAFVQEYGLQGAKKALCGDIDDYCPAMVDRFQKAGRWFSSPEIGDLVFFRVGLEAGHVEYVYYKTASRIYTIGGNTGAARGVVANGGQVCYKDYAIPNANIMGYGRPIY